MRRVIRTDADRAAMVGVILRTDIKKPYVLEWKRLAKSRSLPQNSIYWKWLSCMAEETGHTKEELHEYFSEKYLPADDRQVLGHRVQVRRSTTGLDTAEFTSYLNQIEQEAMGLGVYLPKPSMPGWDDFYERYRI